jgi:O-antigen/teichoic acid export membrane protein
LYGSAYIFVLASGFDRVILLLRGGVECVGLYAPVAAVLSVMTAVSATVASYSYPRTVYKYAMDGDCTAVRRSTFLLVAGSVAIACVAAGVGWAVVPVAIEGLFPEYARATQAVKLALIGGVFMAGDGIAVAFRVIKAWTHLYVYVLCMAGAKWLLPWYLSESFEPLEGVALGGAIAAAVSFCLGLLLCLHATRSGDD